MNTIKLGIQSLSARTRSTVLPLAILAMWTTTGVYPVRAQQSTQQTFPSAAEATQTLFRAVQHNHVQAIANILGGPTDLTSCGDEAQDKLDRELFVQKYQEMHRLGRAVGESVILYIGAENWPFPIPLVEKNGVWRFDPDSGRKEVLFRRIGENELTAIAICREFLAAKKQHNPQPGTADPADMFAASLAARTGSEPTAADPVLFQGYYFRALATRPITGDTMTSGVALIAYPADYRSSGVMTFMVTNNDVVYEKDLGPKTSAVATATTTFHKDATWHVADE